MQKTELARRLGRQAGVSAAEAADRLDGVVQHILRNLRRGKATQLPGLGSFVPGPKGRPRFRPERRWTGGGRGRR